MSSIGARKWSAIVAALFAAPLVVGALAPAGLGASPPPANGDWVVAEDTAVTGLNVHLNGNLTVQAGRTLTLDGIVLYMELDATWISLEAGSTLSLLRGAAIKDSPTDVDDGSASDWSYRVMAAANAVLRMSTASLEGSLGLDATDASITMVDSVVKANRGPIALAGASFLHATNTSFNQTSAPAFDVTGTSRAVVEGMGLPTYTAGLSASFAYSSFLSVKVNDTTGKPLIGAEWGVETAGGVVAASPLLGGTAPTTRLNLDGFSVPTWALAPYIVQEAGVRSMPGVIVRARVAEWSDARLVNTSMDQVVSFTSMNRGVVLEDASHGAMLDVYHGMEDMMMGDMGPHDMGDMGMMGMMDMMGPMMTQGPGSAWGDFNRDGHVDVVVTAAPETDEMMLMDMNMSVTDYPAPQLFLGMGDGMFHHEMTSGLDAALGAQGASAGDFDGDGDLDLFVARYGNGGMAMEDALMRISFMDGHPLTSFIFRNDGHGMFTDVTAEVGFTMPARYTTGGVWNDYNRDGCLDLYVVNMGQMVMLMMEGASMDDMMHMGMDMNYVKPQANYLFKNDCAGKFTDVTAAAGSPTGGLSPGGESGWQSLSMDPVSKYWYANSTGKSLGGSGVSYTAAFFDADEDGWPDLLVANDFGYSPLYRNNGDGTFTQETAKFGFDKIGSAMGFAIADYNRDGHLDVFQSNFNEDYLWVADGDGTFTDRAQEFGVDDMAVGWGVGAPDINSDGYPDLVISTGYMSMMMKASERSTVYVNDRGTRFWDGSAGSGIDEDPAVGISLAMADIDEDGKLDFFLGKTTGMNKLYLNREAGANHLRIDLRGMSSNSFGVGAEVTAKVGGKPFRAVVQPGGEYASSNERGVFIGLGAEMEAKEVVITWPSGVSQSLGTVMAGAHLTAREMVASRVDAGPDGVANTSEAVMLEGAVVGTQLQGATYTWTFHGPTAAVSVEGKAVEFRPPAPGVYTAELTVADRFGETYGSDFCIMTVTDTSAPNVRIVLPKNVTATGRPAYDATTTTDNDPAFALAANYTWTFRLGTTEVTAYGAKPNVQLPKAGTWDGALTVRDASNNSIVQSFSVRVTGAGPAPLTQDMVLLAILIPMLSILAIALVQPRIWKHEGGDGLAPEHFGELRAHDIVVAEVAGADAPPFPFRPDRQTEEE